MNEHFSLNIDELRNKYRVRCSNRTKIYEKLLEKCYYRINNAAENDDTFYLYLIPDFSLGMPTYNLAYCAAFIIYNLKYNGFNTKFFNPNVIFITWNYNIPPYIKNDPRKTITYQDNKLLMPPTSNTSKIIEVPKPKQTYRSTTDYKPTGNFICN